MNFSISDAIRQNSRGLSEGFPAGVPKSYNWYKGWSDEGMHTPPADFTAVVGWGAIYQQVGAPAYSNPDAAVEVANAKTYVLEKTGQWVLVQDQSKSPIVGGHFVPDFAGNAGYAMKVTPLAGGGASFAAPPSGYNNHFWHQSRGTYQAGTVDAVYVQMDMRVTDPNLDLVAIVGADWWRDANAPYLHDHSNNPGVGSSNWIKLSTEWKSLGFYSVSPTELQNNLPPPLRGVVSTPPIGSKSDTTPPATPTITAFTPDTGMVGDTITGASVLTLSGTAEAASIVKLFDGATQIGTARANASGAWSIETSQLAAGTHNFTATATDAAGNTSSASSLLNVMMDAAGASPPPASPRATPSGENLLEMFDATSVGVDERAGFNGNDGSYRTVQTVARQGHNLSFDARPRPGFTGTTTTIEVLSNNSFILIALLFGAIVKIGRNSSLDRRERES